MNDDTEFAVALRRIADFVPTARHDPAAKALLREAWFQLVDLVSAEMDEPNKWEAEDCLLFHNYLGIRIHDLWSRTEQPTDLHHEEG